MLMMAAHVEEMVSAIVPAMYSAEDMEGFLRFDGGSRSKS